MKAPVLRSTLALAAAALLAAACANPGGIHSQAALEDPAKLAASRALEPAMTSPAAWPAADWWKRFGDPQLDRLVEEGLKDSPTLRTADARVRKAVAAAAATGAARAPQLNLAANATYQRFPEHGIYPPPLAGAWKWTPDITASLGFDLDLWGRLGSAERGALDEARAVQVDRKAAELLLSASIVRAYIQLQRTYDQLDVAQALLRSRDELRALVEQRRAAGLDSMVELRQAEAALPEARERVSQLEETVALTRNQLAALLGQGPDRGLAIERPAMQAAGAFVLPSRLPADLIGRRPDIVAQRWRIEAASKTIDAARAEFYPNVNLVAFAGLQSIGLAQFLQAGSLATGAGPALRLPIFDGGRLRANLAGRNADYDLAIEQYNQALVEALREVVDQLASSRAIETQRRDADAGRRIAQDAYDLALLRYREGLGNYLQVLSAESLVLAQRNLQADLAARALEVRVNLARALGGGYEETN